MEEQNFGPNLVDMAIKQIENNPKVKTAAKQLATYIKVADLLFSRLSEQDLVDYLSRQNNESSSRFSHDEVVNAAKELHKLPEESKDLLSYLDGLSK